MLSTIIYSDIYTIASQFTHRTGKEYSRLLEEGKTTLVLIVVETTKKDEVPVDVDPVYKFLKRKSQPEDLISFRFAVIGIGNSDVLITALKQDWYVIARLKDI